MKETSTTGQLRERSEIGSFSDWNLPPKDLVLGSDEVHIWRAFLDIEAPHTQNLHQTLSVDERARAARFYFQKDRQRFIVARGLLRLILGRYLHMEPSQLRFCHSYHGKPALSREVDEDGIRFNLSHCQGLVLYAITRGREIGVDLERVRPDLADEHIAEHFFSPREVGALRVLPANMQKEAFFNCWTRKEAYIKAKGEGLSLPLDQFDVSLIPGEPATLLSINGDPQEASRWSLQELAPGPGFVAALSVEGHDWRVKCWQWHKK